MGGGKQRGKGKEERRQVKGKERKERGGGKKDNKHS